MRLKPYRVYFEPTPTRVGSRFPEYSILVPEARNQEHAVALARESKLDRKDTLLRVVKL